jgi:IS5 family transposase
LFSLLYLKISDNLSDEELVDRRSGNVVRQFFSGMEYYEPRLPCDTTQWHITIQSPQLILMLIRQ